MWQRVQTLFIGLATALITALYWSIAARYVDGSGTVEIPYTDKPVYLIWIIVLTVLQVLSLGGYKWRMRQFRVVLVTGFACLWFQGWLVYDYIRLHNEIVFSWTALFPLAAAVMDFFGARNILLDEAIVQSANRLRGPRKKK